MSIAAAAALLRLRTSAGSANDINKEWNRSAAFHSCNAQDADGAAAYMGLERMTQKLQVMEPKGEAFRRHVRNVSGNKLPLPDARMLSSKVSDCCKAGGVRLDKRTKLPA